MISLKKIAFAAHAFVFNPTVAMIAPPEPNSCEKTQAINNYTDHFFNTLSIPTIALQIRTTYQSLQGKGLDGLHSCPTPLTKLFCKQQLRQVGLDNITYDDACRLIVGLSILLEQRIQQELFAASLEETIKKTISSEALFDTINIINSILEKNNGLPESPKEGLPENSIVEKNNELSESLKKRVNPARYFEYLYMNPNKQYTQEVFKLIQRATVQKTIDRPSNCSSYESIIKGEYSPIDTSSIEQINELRTVYIQNQLDFLPNSFEEEAIFITDNDLQTLISELAEDLTQEPLSQEIKSSINVQLKEYFTNRYHS